LETCSKSKEDIKAAVSIPPFATPLSSQNEELLIPVVGIILVNSLEITPRIEHAKDTGELSNNMAQIASSSKTCIKEETDSKSEPESGAVLSELSKSEIEEVARLIKSTLEVARNSATPLPARIQKLMHWIALMANEVPRKIGRFLRWIKRRVNMILGFFRGSRHEPDTNEV
jgi:hypothetical protein